MNGVAYEDRIPAAQRAVPGQGQVVNVTYLPNDPKQATLTEMRPTDNSSPFLLGLALIVAYPVIVAVYVVFRRLSPPPIVDI